MKHQHRFTEQVPVINLSQFRSECGHEWPCDCRSRPAFERDPDYELWLTEYMEKSQ